MEPSEKRYYLVTEDGTVYGVDGCFHKDQSAVKMKTYRNVRAAKTAASVWGQYMRQKIRVMDVDGNEVE